LRTAVAAPITTTAAIYPRDCLLARVFNTKVL
jgi:hypothetical protein